MARAEDQKALKALKAAKTTREMVLSWAVPAPGRNMDPQLKALNLYMERKPEMIQDFAQTPITGYTERGILDAKTRALCLIAICLGMKSKEGVVAQVANALGAGCTQEEIMEVAYLASYQGCKAVMATSSAWLAEAFEFHKDVKKDSV